MVARVSTCTGRGSIRRCIRTRDQPGSRIGTPTAVRISGNSMLTGKQAWALLFAIVVAHEITAKRGELLSEEVDRQLTSHRWATITFGALTVGHLYNVVPPRIDPYHQLAALVGFMTRKVLD
ncbi:DUF7427 family protein [Nocardia terpenica]